MKIRFLQTRTVKAVDGVTFEQDKVYDLPEASARHWLNRRVAVQVGNAAKAEPGPRSAKAEAVEQPTSGAIADPPIDKTELKPRKDRVGEPETAK